MDNTKILLTKNDQVHVALTVDDQKYVGNINPDLIPQMDSLTFNFRNMEYECKLKVEYTPESALSKEKYEYTILDIAEVGDGGS